MEGGRVLFDASTCMLFEASGDSEAEYFDTSVEAELDAAVAEDDAQSCSCGWLSDYAAVHETDASTDDFNGGNFDDYIEKVEEDSGGASHEVEEDSGGASHEVEDGVVDQCRGGGKAAAVAEEEKLNKQKACEDPNLKLMNEREMDRLFWEACLAS